MLQTLSKTLYKQSPDVGMIRTAKTEINMSPTVAKQLRELLDKELQKYE